MRRVPEHLREDLLHDAVARLDGFRAKRMSKPSGGSAVMFVLFVNPKYAQHALHMLRSLELSGPYGPVKLEYVEVARRSLVVD